MRYTHGRAHARNYVFHDHVSLEALKMWIGMYEREFAISTRQMHFIFEVAHSPILRCIDCVFTFTCEYRHFILSSASPVPK